MLSGLQADEVTLLLVVMTVSFSYGISSTSIIPSLCHLLFITQALRPQPRSAGQLQHGNVIMKYPTSAGHRKEDPTSQVSHENGLAYVVDAEFGVLHYETAPKRDR